jgi:hypothetical protein
LEVSLMDVQFVGHCAGQCHGIVTFDLKPAGESSCILQMPDGTRIIHIVVAGLPGRIKSIDHGRWNVALGPTYLPQRIEVVFERNADDSPWQAELRRFESPYLLDVPVKKTLWTIFGAGRSTVISSPQNDKVASPAMLELARLENIVELMDLRGEAAPGASAEEMRRWRRPWENRVRASQALLTYHGAAEGASYAAELNKIMDGAPDLPAPNLTGDNKIPLVTAPKAVIEAAVSEEPPARFLCTGAATVIDIRFPASPHGTLLDRWRYAIDIAGLVVVGTLLSQRVSLRRWMIYAALIIAGIGSWLLLTPSFPGFVVAAGVTIYLITDRKRLLDLA